MELTKAIAKVEADEALTADAKKAEVDKLSAEKATYEAKIKSRRPELTPALELARRVATGKPHPQGSP